MELSAPCAKGDGGVRHPIARCKISRCDTRRHPLINLSFHCRNAHSKVICSRIQTILHIANIQEAEAEVRLEEASTATAAGVLCVSCSSIGPSVPS